MVPGSIKSIWNTTAQKDSMEATEGNGSVAGTYLNNHSPNNVFDNSSATKYTSRGNSTGDYNFIAGLNTGFYVTVGPCPSILTGFIFTSASGDKTRDPLRITVEGNIGGDLTKGVNWKLIYNGSTGLENIASPPSDGLYQTIVNTETYTSYRFLVTLLRGPKSDSASYSEVKLYGTYVSGAATSSGKYLHFSLFLQCMK